jgi:glutaredoxin-related protein
MKKHKPLLIIGIILAAIALLLVLGRLTNRPKAGAYNPAGPEMILFYGDTCPHCEIVEQYIKDNNIKTKYQFQELEVFNNQDNAALLAEKARTCNLDTSAGVGVPFFYAGGQTCLLGDQDIINFFKK